MYAIQYTNPGKVVKLSMPENDGAAQRLGVLTLDPGEMYPRCAVIDSANGHLYLATTEQPGRIVKIAIGGTLPVREGSLVLDPGEDHPSAAVIDETAARAYFATQTSPGKIVKVALAPAGLPTRIGALTLDPDESNPGAGLINPAAGHAWFATGGTAAPKVVKLALRTRPRCPHASVPCS